MKKIDGYSIPIVEEDGKIWALHQVKTYEELEKCQIVLNTYPTGTGKTKALLNAIRKKGFKRVLIIAPINELIHQYKSSIERFKAEHNLEHEVFLVTSETLDEMNGRSHSRTLRDILKKDKAIVVTNPDIVHYVLLQKYGTGPMNRTLIVDLLKFPELVAFDEFHYYDPSRLFFAFVFIATSIYFNIPQKYILMTATPSREMQEVFAKMGITVSKIDYEADQCTFLSVKTATPLEAEILKGKIDDYVDLIEEKIVKESDKDILIISDSLRRLIKLAKHLREKRLDFGLVTGPMAHEQRKINLEKRVILATPTIDVGYEIERPQKHRQAIDIIFFEARDSDDIVQRLGRVGRVFGKKVTDMPSQAFVIVPPKIFSRVLESLNRSSNRLEFSKTLRELVPSRIESLKREFLGPFRLIIAFFEDVFCLLFPKDQKGILSEYFKLLEKFFGLEPHAVRNLCRNELDMYYLSIADEKTQGDILKRNPELQKTLQELYQDDHELREALEVYRHFIERFILPFRASGDQVYVRDPKKLSGADSFVYEKFAIITQYRVKNLTSWDIPEDLRSSVKEAYRLEAPLERFEKPFIRIRTRAKSRFFVPLEIEFTLMNDVFHVGKLRGVPVYLVNPDAEKKCFLLDFHPVKAEVNSYFQKVLIGSEALKAQSYLEEKPWECDLFPR